MTDKKNDNKGIIISSLGALFTIFGTTLMSMKSSKILYLSCTFLGVILAAYGVFIMAKTTKSDKK
ncbi:hypothetical protein UMM65_14455 [Aureibaculum sp. 2210JD6-5]|uniref:hypothetical protein n=1 Tax=Aureibaculum sp. 2210JD6-5 TaxID=3103957 RepID=UPI002AAC5F97|nr:hypothetical protein [Aureibaculum sp. 2210JD6-5]MDY7396449.1 hypothetical protein [Aureibaculum sp. 2210JD6-5]